MFQYGLFDMDMGIVGLGAWYG